MKKLLLISFALPLSALNLIGAVVVDNLANTDSTIATGNTFNYQAQQFTTDTGTYRISQITVHAEKLGGVTPFFEVYSDNAGEPDSILFAGADFDTSAITTSLGDRVLTPNNNIDLSPSTPYWIVARADNFDLRWMRTTDTSFSSDASSTMGEAKFTTNSGSTWNDYTSPDYRFLITIEANAIPEPYWYAIILAILALAYALYTRKSRLKLAN